MRNWRLGGLALFWLVAAAGCQTVADDLRFDDRGGVSAEISRLLVDVQVLAIDPVVDAQLAAIAADGQRAAIGGDRAFAEAQLVTLKDINETLVQEYKVRIVSRQGVDTGFSRESREQPQIVNYYLVVEAIAPDNRLLTVPITSVETQETERVSIWAQRVSQATFERVRAEKTAAGILTNDMFGAKLRGQLEPTFVEPVPGGAITKW